MKEGQRDRDGRTEREMNGFADRSFDQSIDPPFGRNTTHLNPQARTDVGLAISVDGAIEDLKGDLDG